MAAKLEDLIKDDEYFKRAIVREEIQFDEHGLPILAYTSVLEHLDSEIEDIETLAGFLGITPRSVKTNIRYGEKWLFDGNRRATAGKIESYAYMKAKRSQKNYETRESELILTLNKLVEHERSLYPSGNGRGVGIGTPADASSTPTGIFERTGYELYQINDLVKGVKLENGDYIADPEELAKILLNGPELSDSLRAHYSHLIEEDGAISLGNLVIILGHWAEEDPRDIETVILDLGHYLDNIAKYDKDFGLPGYGDTKEEVSKSYPDPQPGLPEPKAPVAEKRLRKPRASNPRPRRPVSRVAAAERTVTRTYTRLSPTLPDIDKETLDRELEQLRCYKIINTGLFIPDEYYHQVSGVNIPMTEHRKQRPELFGRNGRIPLGDLWDLALSTATKDPSHLNIRGLQGLNLFDYTLSTTGYEAAFEAVKKMPVMR